MDASRHSPQGATILAQHGAKRNAGSEGANDLSPFRDGTKTVSPLKGLDNPNPNRIPSTHVLGYDCGALRAWMSPVLDRELILKALTKSSNGNRQENRGHGLGSIRRICSRMGASRCHLFRVSEKYNHKPRSLAGCLSGIADRCLFGKCIAVSGDLYVAADCDTKFRPVWSTRDECYLPVEVRLTVP